MQRRQFFVKLQDKNQGDQFIKYLESNGYENIHKLSFDNLRIKVVVIDNKVFFSTNATCLAALSQSGIRPISIDDFMTETEGNAEDCNVL